MMKKVFKGLEINEKDNLWTAVAKGGTEGALNSFVGSILICGVIYGIGKYKQSKEVIQGETAE